MAKKISTGTKRGMAYISGVEQDEDGNVGATKSHKPSIGQTGIHLCYHKPDEYFKLTSKQKLELKEWRENNPEVVKQSKKRKFSGKPSQKKLMKTVSKLVVKAFNKKEVPGKPDMASEKKDPNETIAAMVELVVQKKLAALMAMLMMMQAATVSLKSILKNAKNAAKSS